MQLYVWHGVLQDWSSGIAFALAHSVEEAKALLIANGIDEDHWKGVLLDGQACEIHASPVAFSLYGGG